MDLWTGSTLGIFRRFMTEWSGHFMKNDLDWCEARVTDDVLVARLVAWVRDLDVVLTGKTSCRNVGRDTDEVRELLGGGRWIVYLSDGGYSRLVVDLVEGQFGLDKSVSRPEVIAAWRALAAAED